MPLSRDEIISCYRMILGRDPESESVVRSYAGIRELDELTHALLSSAEFRLSPRFKDVLTVLPKQSDKKGTRWPHQRRSQMRVAVIGNCQAAGVARLLQAMTGGMRARSLELSPALMERIDNRSFDLSGLLESVDLVFMQPAEVVLRTILSDHPHLKDRIRLFPPIASSAFHPDATSVNILGQGPLRGPLDDYHSSIAFWAWQAGWSVEEALTLYQEEVYRDLGFFNHGPTSEQVLLEYGRMTDLPMEPLLKRWRSHGCWMHTVNHPALFALADLTAALLRREGIEPMEQASNWVEDALAKGVIWPVYPAIARHLGVPGAELFKVSSARCPHEQPILTLSLPDFVKASYDCYNNYGRDKLVSDRIGCASYAALASRRPAARSLTVRLWQGVANSLGRLLADSDVTRSPAVQESTPKSVRLHPYAQLPARQFWRDAMQGVPWTNVDPVSTLPWRMDRKDKIATAGSCFAQHISRTLTQYGFNYFVAEQGEELAAHERESRQFGLFSGRYGNIYTARQLFQLLQRAVGEFKPLDEAWQRPDGRWVDPFRPQVEPLGFGCVEEVRVSRDAHLNSVREMFESLDVFVFTLGLTECWQNKQDGAVYPLAPGVVAGRFDPEQHAFENHSVAQVHADIRNAIDLIRRLNPSARLIFTVSPVPLIATYEDRHVLVATAESKAVLRAAVGEVTHLDKDVIYFPSFEIITGQHARGMYFSSDLRSVTQEGVNHVMRLFLLHCAAEPGIERSEADISSGPDTGTFPAMLAEQRRTMAVLCDEEALSRPPEDQ